MKSLELTARGPRCHSDVTRSLIRYPECHRSLTLVPDSEINQWAHFEFRLMISGSFFLKRFRRLGVGPTVTRTVADSTMSLVTKYTRKSPSAGRTAYWPISADFFFHSRSMAASDSPCEEREGGDGKEFTT